MNRLSVIVVAAILITLTGCGESSGKPVAIQPAPAQKKAESESTKAVIKPVAAVKTTQQKSAINYRAVTARLRENGEEVQIMVPEGVDVGSDRLIEIREGDDGQYYYVSLIPQ